MIPLTVELVELDEEMRFVSQCFESNLVDQVRMVCLIARMSLINTALSNGITMAMLAVYNTYARIKVLCE